MGATSSLENDLKSIVVSVTNDLSTPIEVKLQSGEWQVVYPKRSCDVEACGEASVTSVEVRLRESPEVKGSCQATGGSALRASADFEAFSQRAKGRDRAEARELVREGKRREEARKRTDAMIEQAAAKERGKKQLWFFALLGTVVVLPLTLLAICAAIPPETAVAAAVLATAATPLWCSVSIYSASAIFYESSRRTKDLFLGRYAVVVSAGARLAVLLASLSLAAMTARHVLRGYWTTAFIVGPAAFYGSAAVFLVLCGVPFMKRPGGGKWRSKLRDRLKEHVKKLTSDVLQRERERAQFEVSNRTIAFEGSVIRERGLPCVASWPGKYEGAWESLVSQGRNGEVSAAVVFLPEHTDDYGKCDSISETEGLPGTCWCTPLYGEKKPWGCRWFTKWRENIETAVESGAELEVYYFQNLVGNGKVKGFDTAGDDSLQREEINKKQSDFEQSPEFEQAP